MAQGLFDAGGRVKGLMEKLFQAQLEFDSVGEERAKAELAKVIRPAIKTQTGAIVTGEVGQAHQGLFQKHGLRTAQAEAGFSDTSGKTFISRNKLGLDATEIMNKQQRRLFERLRGFKGLTGIAGPAGHIGGNLFEMIYGPLFQRQKDNLI